MPPIGCLPSQRTLRGGPERKCVDEYNEIAESFNKKLSDELESMNRELSGARVVYIDIYSLTLDVIESPERYGKFSIDFAEEYLI